MKNPKLFLVFIGAALLWTVSSIWPVHSYGTHSQTVFREPLGTPESPELRNDPAKPLQIVSAACDRAFVAGKGRCAVKTKFANVGGPWSGFTLIVTLRYDNGKTVVSTWRREGRQADGITTDLTHFKTGDTTTMGEGRSFGAKDKTGRQLDIVNVAVQVGDVILLGGGSGGGGSH